MRKFNKKFKSQPFKKKFIIKKRSTLRTYVRRAYKVLRKEYFSARNTAVVKKSPIKNILVCFAPRQTNVK